MISTFSVLFVAALLSLLLHRTKWLKPFALVSLLGSFYLTFIGYSMQLIGFQSSDALQFFELIVFIVLFAIILHEDEELTMTQTLFIAAASVALLESNTLVSFIISFEALSILSFVLVSYIHTADQAEGAVKMFIAGAIATGLLLLGTSLYLIGGGVLEQGIQTHLSSLSIVGIFIVLLGVFYKLTVVPMHSWAADTYALVSHSHAAILTGVVKTVVAVATFKMFASFLSEQIEMSVPLLAVLVVITMTLGNFMALFQKRIAKILAYSSIAHAGYILLAFMAVKSKYASTGLLYMAIAYIFMQTAVFLVLDTLRKNYDIQELDDLKGLAKNNKLLAFFFTLQLFSLAGIPLIAGFLGKAIVFYAGVDSGLWYIVFIALLNSALSLGYYAWIVKHFYFDVAMKEQNVFKNKAPFLAQTILMLGTIYFGIFASLVFNVSSVF